MRIQFLFLFIILGSLLVGCGSTSFAESKPTPFEINKRPQPTGKNLEVLLPKTVGTFTREDLPADAQPRSAEDLNVEYKSGNETIFFGFSLPKTEKDAFEAIRVTRQEAIAGKISLKGEEYLIGKNPSYFKIADFMSWSRGKYFFYAKASSPQALERFMKSFPY